jgi:hypothetical protein
MYWSLFFQLVHKRQKWNSITSIYKIEEALDWNPHEKLFPRDLGPVEAITGAEAAGPAAISLTDVIEDESEKNSQK